MTTPPQPGSAPPAGYREVVLPDVPSLGRLYAKALGRMRTLVLARPPARDLPAVALRVDGVRADAGRLAEYQHLLGEPGTDVLPAGFVHVLAFPVAMALMVREDFPLQALGLVHVANQVEQHRPLRLEDELTVRAWAENARAHQRGTQVDLVVTVADGAGRLAWRGVSTYLSRGRPPAGLTVAPAEERPEPTAVPAAATAVWRLGADVGRRYAEVSGDRNPIHVSRVGARLFGFRRPIAHGMYTAARALAATSGTRGGSFVWTAEFVRPVVLPATVAFASTRPAGADPAGTDQAGTQAAGVRYVVWDRRSGKVRLAGSVVPL